MKKYLFIGIFLWFNSKEIFAQPYPAFGPEKKVTISGLTFDAMEPFISLDGNTLFFNSLNSGGLTNLYYASKVDDTTFNFIGLVGGCYDPVPGHLDAVASIDSLNNFFWVSLRNYPAVFENLHRGQYVAGNVTNITRVYGDFNIFTPGWLIMDGTINFQGDLLYYNNAYFNSCAFGMPCEAFLGVAQKINDSTFNKIPTSDFIFSNVNDTNYIVYAPQVTKSGLELYFTRILKSTVNSEICVSVRNSITDPFSLPMVIHSNLGFVPEAATLTVDKQKLYYHEKNSSGVFDIRLRYNTSLSVSEVRNPSPELVILPNPANATVTITVPDKNSPFEIQLFSTDGKLLITSAENNTLLIWHLAKGIYIIKLKQNNLTFSGKLIID